MHNYHFKPPVLQFGQRPRTPSSPRAYIEPLSPIDGSGHAPSHQLANGAPLNGSLRVNNKTASTSVHTGINSDCNKHGHRRTSSTIDELADAALANDSAFATPHRKSSAAEGQRWPLDHNRHVNVGQAYGDAPHKRARSEHIPIFQADKISSRPATSHDHANGRLYGQFCAPPSYESRVEEAALLLNFRTGGWPTAVSSPLMPPIPQAPPVRPHANSFPQDAHHQRPAEALPRTLYTNTDTPKTVSSSQPKSAISNAATDTPMTDVAPQSAAAEDSLTKTTGQDFGKVTETSHDDANTDGRQSTKASRGWPKGKPRGASARRPVHERIGQKRANKKSADTARSRRRQRKHKDESPGASDDEQSRPRRQSFHGTTSTFEQVALQVDRARSVPREVAMIITPPTVERPGRGKNETQVDTVCAACNTAREANSRNVELDEWISCNGCKGWFHIDCAGFKNANEIRDIGKFFCPVCEPNHGKTTYVRKSSRAHASVDYAELQKGVLKMSEESVEHHYIKPIKDGTFQFDPETFPRIRPELMTKELLETSNIFTEPICIPAEWNPRPWTERQRQNRGLDSDDNLQTSAVDPLADQLTEDFEYDMVEDYGQDRLGMVMPEDLSVRQVCNLVGAERPLEVIDVKTQNSGAKWNLGRWADYYEDPGENKVIRNVLSLEVSGTKLGRLLKRPQVVRDIDLQDDVWPQEETDRGRWPKVQFYCLMSVADSYTDFHVDFGGSSVYYHILKGSKVFFFIPPKAKHLKAYEEWNDSQHQNYTFLPTLTKECYRVDLHEGDTMLIPSGWIHAVWTPTTSLVIGGNFTTRLSYKNQFRIVEIERINGTDSKFCYPHFQRLMWYAALKYLRDEPLPESVRQNFLAGLQFSRAVQLSEDYDGSAAATDPRPGAANARYYSRAELDGLPHLVNYIFHTVLISMGRIEGVSTKQSDKIHKEIPKIPKDYGGPLEVAKTFALWVAWKRGNEDPPAWAHPNAILPSKSDERPIKKLSARALKNLERKEAFDAWRVAPDRQSDRVMNRIAATSAANAAAAAASATATFAPAAGKTRDSDLWITNNNLPQASASGFSTTTSAHQDSSAAWYMRDDMAETAHLHAQNGVAPHAARNGVLNAHNTHHYTDTPGGSSMASMALMMSGQHLSTPKTSVLGPKRVACDVCRRRRIRCKHKDIVQQLDATPNVDSNGGISLATPDMHDNITVSPSMGRDGVSPYGGVSQYGDQDSAYVNTGIPMTVNGVAIFGEIPRKGRTKACDECRKSKRRCVHDENGNVDPIKAREAPVPRGSLGVKKRESNDGNITAMPSQSKPQPSRTTNNSQENALGAASNPQNSAIDPNLFTMYTESGDANGYVHPTYSFPSENGHIYDYPSLEQIANEVLDMNGHSNGITSESLEAPSHGFFSHAHPPVSSESVDSVPSVVEPITPEQDLEIPNVDPELGRRTTPEPGLAFGAQQTFTEHSTVKPMDGLALYQPPAPLSPSSPSNGTAGMNGAQKRKRVSFSASPDGTKKGKIIESTSSLALDSGAAPEHAQENEDERLARALQQEGLGLRRRSK